mmetsp:Transcript_33714/g.57833  ORF Transcript_33714/g.57833 Transcript_33714/m.57833 type:complete len:102 (-) Transcript_33714:67-372(-)
MRSPHKTRSPRNGEGSAAPALESQLLTVQQRLERIEALMLEIHGGRSQSSTGPAMGQAPPSDFSSDDSTNSRILEYAEAAQNPELLRYLSAYRDLTKAGPV